MNYSWMGMFLAALLLIIQLLFQFQLFTFAFIILLILLISVAFLPENNRVFVWTLVSFSVGLFAFIYIGRIILELPFSHVDTFILTRFLLVLPILFMSYVIRKFNQRVLLFSKKIEWNETFVFGGVKKTFRIVIAVLGLILIYLLWKSRSYLFDNLPKVVLFSLINGVLVELIWRGILLTRLQLLVGSKLAVLVSSISCAIAYYLFGYTFPFCLVFFVLCLFLGTITWKTKSLVPAIILNVLLTLILIFMNVVPLIVIK